MNEHILKFRKWFEGRILREKIFVFLLSWAAMYALFSLIVFQPIENKKKVIVLDIKKNQDKITGWQNQIKFVEQIPTTPLYKEWMVRHQHYLSMKATYRNLFGDRNNKNWEKILKTVLSDYPNVTVEAVRHSPESVYQTTAVTRMPEKIYQQQLQLTVSGSYFDLVGYLAHLEKMLPNIHWNTLVYEVKDYPTAQLDVEFSILYEKSPA